MVERIDVVMCTYNSNKPYFSTVLQRILEEVPVHCFVVVDRFSSDGTVDKVLELFPQAKVILSLENLGRARKIGVGVVDTSFFAFIDDDVLLVKGWYNHTKGLLNSRIGAVACYARPKTPLLRGVYKHATRPRLVVSSKKNMDSQRGFLCATLMRKKVVGTWEPDNMLTAGEDHEILRHAVRNGFFWVTSYFAFAEHLYPDQSYLAFFRDIWKNTVWNTAGCRYIKLIRCDPVQLTVTSLFEFCSAIKTSFLSRNAFAFAYHCVNGLALFYGSVCWKKELFLQR